MPEIHISPELLEAVERGDLPARVLTEVGWNHLMSLCPICRGGYRAWVRSRRTSVVNYDSAFKLLPALLERHAEEAGRAKEKGLQDFRELMKLGHEERLAKIKRAASRFRGISLVQILLREARERIPAKPQEVFELVEVAEAVLLRTAHTPGYFDALARGMAYKGNSRRALGKLREADEYIRQARSLIRHQDISDTLVFAEVDWLEGVLRKDQRYFEEAEDLLRRSAALFQLAGETIEATRPLIALGGMYDYAGDLARAIEVTTLALRNLDPKSEVSLDLALLYLKEGRAVELREIAEEMHAVFASEDIHREALSALVLFQEAVRQEEATAEYIGEIASYLRRARRNPSLKFRVAAG